MKKELIARILPSLWNQVQEHCESSNETIPKLLDDYLTLLLEEANWTLPFEINRRITSYHLKKKFSEEFVLVRKSIMVDHGLLTEVARLAQEKAKVKYKNSSRVNFPSVVRISLYMLIRSQGYYISDSNFYSDDYFSTNYSLESEESFLKKMDVLYQKYKRLPTAREYAQIGGSLSLSYIKVRFGSYNQAIKFYQEKRSGLLLDKSSIPYNKKITS